MDRHRSGRVAAHDILAFLGENNLEEEDVSQVTLTECKLCVDMYDEDRDGALDYSEFCRMVLHPNDLAAGLAHQLGNSADIEKSTKLPFDVEYALVRIVLQEI